MHRKKIAWGRKLFATLAAIAGLVAPAHSWKVGTHIASGNQVIDDLATGGRLPFGTGLLQFNDPLTGRTLQMEITQKQAVQAITAWPEYFRAGLVGPDGFPDMGTGQMLQHSNESVLFRIADRKIKNNGPDFLKTRWASWTFVDDTYASVKLDERATPSQFRSVDFAMSMLLEAKAYIADLPVVDPKTKAVTYRSANNVSPDEKAQILAFIIGYIGHCIGDGQGHTYINEYARGAWDYLEGQGIFGPESEEIKHVVVEGFIDRRIPGSLRNSDGVAGKAEDRYKISLPVAFLDKFFSTKHSNVQIADPNSSDYQDFLAAYSDIDQFYGGPFYSYFNLQVDAADHVTKWAGMDRALNIVDDFDPVVSIFESVNNAIDDIVPSWVDDFEDFAKGPLTRTVSGGLLDCSSPGVDVTFFDVWNKLKSIRPNLKKWQGHSVAVRKNWIMMSRCTAENIARINGGDFNAADPVASKYRDACAEMADAPWADEAGANRNSLFREGMRGSFNPIEQADETADQEFMRRTKEAFRGESNSAGQTFEQQNKHRLVAANIERAYSYLLGVSITIDDLLEIFSPSSNFGRETMDYYCGMANGSRDPQRRCWELTKMGEVFTVLTAFCIYDAAKGIYRCQTEAYNNFTNCTDDVESWCGSQPLATITIPRVCFGRRWWKFCVGGYSFRDWPWIIACEATGDAACLVAFTGQDALCTTSKLGKFVGCEVSAMWDAIPGTGFWDPFWGKLNQGCQAIQTAQDALQLYRRFDTKEERVAFLREKGVPVDQLYDLKRVWSSVLDKIRDLPDTYIMNMVFIQEDLQDGGYQQQFADALTQAEANIRAAGEADMSDALLVVDHLRTLASDIAQKTRKFYYPFAPADLQTSIGRVQDTTTRSGLSTHYTTMVNLVQTAQGAPFTPGLQTQIANEIAQLRSLPISSSGAFSREGFEQRDAMVAALQGLSGFVNSVLNANATNSFNNYTLMKIPFRNLIDGISYLEGYASREVDLALKYQILPQFAGPTATKVLRDIGQDPAITFTPFYNTVQGLKLDLATGKTDWDNLFTKYAVNRSLLPWNLPQTPGGRQLYSNICKDPNLNGFQAVSIYCDVLKSNDNPTCYGCEDWWVKTGKTDKTGKPFDGDWSDFFKSRNQLETVAKAGNDSLVWDWSKGIVAWGPNYGTPNAYVNFPIAAKADGYTTLYSNIFRNPGAPKGPYLDQIIPNANTRIDFTGPTTAQYRFIWTSICTDASTTQGDGAGINLTYPNGTDGNMLYSYNPSSTGMRCGVWDTASVFLEAGQTVGMQLLNKGQISGLHRVRLEKVLPAQPYSPGLVSVDGKYGYSNLPAAKGWAIVGPAASAISVVLYGPAGQQVTSITNTAGRNENFVDGDFTGWSLLVNNYNYLNQGERVYQILP